MLIINHVAKAGGIDDGQRDLDTILIELYKKLKTELALFVYHVGAATNGDRRNRHSPQHTDGVGLDLDALFNMGHIWLVGLALGDNISIAQRVDKGGTTKSRGTYEWTKEE